MAGINDNTKLMMHMNGADDDTTFPDDSPSAHGNASVTATVQTKTATKKWGTASALFDGDSGFLTYADSADWDIFGSNSDDWTVDFWVKHAAVEPAASEFYICQWEDDENRYMFYRAATSGDLILQVKSGNVWVISAVVGSITDTDWHHVALCKVGNDYGCYVDGNQVGHVMDNNTADTFSGILNIGCLRVSTGTSAYLDGYLEELRIQHSNIFDAAPNVDDTDTITVPTEEYSEKAVITHQFIMVA